MTEAERFEASKLSVTVHIRDTDIFQDLLSLILTVYDMTSDEDIKYLIESEVGNFVRKDQQS